MSYQIDDLLYLMQRLRDPQHGCPWDLEQSFETIVAHTLEEAYEVADAIAEQDYPQLTGELGDLLFQVVYYAQLGQEKSLFDWSQVVDGITRKLIRRHPHVFPDGNLRTPAGTMQLEPEQVKQRWEEIKAQERAERATHPQQLSLLDDVPKALPALSRAQKLQKRASGAGFDWAEPGPVLEKMAEELDEVRDALAQGDLQAVASEMGDLLFAVVNLARHLKVDAETALRQGNEKFERRFRFIENRLVSQGLNLANTSLEHMDQLWDEAKQQGL
ncbi:nucleoside triphosphate pyrophosphohydrolase [uncultured Halopseudomonas sp.]|uniref:nucleoside triphosphate pyrophosphohydrolase n=1 Tax=uncultured Halopseudomonas sp. TaxID=2901193 RepID=UPI0030ECB976